MSHLLSSTSLMDYGPNITFVSLLPTTVKGSLGLLSRTPSLYKPPKGEVGAHSLIHLIHQYKKGRGLELHLDSSLGSEEPCSTRTDVVWDLDFAPGKLFGPGSMLNPFDALLT